MFLRRSLYFVWLFQIALQFEYKSCKNFVKFNLSMQGSFCFKKFETIDGSSFDGFSQSFMILMSVVLKFTKFTFNALKYNPNLFVPFAKTKEYKISAQTRSINITF